MIGVDSIKFPNPVVGDLYGLHNDSASGRMIVDGRPIGPWVVGDNYVWFYFPDNFSNLYNWQILITSVVYATVNTISRKIKQVKIKIYHVFDMNIWPHLITTKYSNFLIVYSVIG